MKLLFMGIMTTGVVIAHVLSLVPSLLGLVAQCFLSQYGGRRFIAGRGGRRIIGFVRGNPRFTTDKLWEERFERKKLLSVLLKL